MLVSTPVGKSFLATGVVKNDSIVFRGRELHVDLYCCNYKIFFIILGMDWLATHHVLVDCFSKRVTFHILGQLEFCFEGSSSDTPVQLVLVMKVQSLLKKGYQGYLVMLWEMIRM